jgi:hypothetical protein
VTETDPTLALLREIRDELRALNEKARPRPWPAHIEAQVENANIRTARRLLEACRLELNDVDPDLTPP